ncbi:hypothetical protein C942_02085 [Photobacterium marinum]|uniref:Uncharacterized protein n=1 Tax=Photobacterium marinum TaxID=1056511 RepID=L8JC61_9GAMM|nr:hypothetical protein C942_02085 [Photobacterium marinum]
MSDDTPLYIQLYHQITSNEQSFITCISNTPSISSGGQFVFPFQYSFI